MYQQIRMYEPTVPLAFAAVGYTREFGVAHYYKILHILHVEHGVEQMTGTRTPEQRNADYLRRTPEQKAAYAAKQAETVARNREEHIAQRAALGLAPGQSKTEEQKAIDRAVAKEAKAERRRLKRLEDIEAAREKDRIKARRIAAAKAEAEGRVYDEPLDRPKQALLTDEEKRERRRVRSANWRAENLERSREIGRDSMRRALAEQAIAEGRVPGQRGRPAVFTQEERRAKRKAKTERHTAANLEETRDKARIREAAKRAGTFVSKALPRLTPEEKRLSDIQWAATRRAMLRNAEGRFTREHLKFLREAQGGKCLFCGEPLGDDLVHLDHWIPLILGGSNEPDNLALLHESCNLRKGPRLPSHFGLPDSPLPLRELLSGSPDDVPIIQEE